MPEIPPRPPLPPRPPAFAPEPDAPEAPPGTETASAVGRESLRGTRRWDAVVGAVRALPRWARRTGAGLALAAVICAVGTGVGVGIALHNHTAAEELWAKVDEARAGEDRLATQVEGLEKRNAQLDAQIDGVSDRELAAGAREDELDAREKAQDERDGELEEREKTVVGAETAAKANSFDSGTHLVGTDIQAGTYRSPGSDGCYWSRLRNLSGELGAIIANGLSDGPVVVNIGSGDKAFESSGCGTWTKVN